MEKDILKVPFVGISKEYRGGQRNVVHVSKNLQALLEDFSDTYTEESEGMPINIEVTYMASEEPESNRFKSLSELNEYLKRIVSYNVMDDLLIIISSDKHPTVAYFNIGDHWNVKKLFEYEFIYNS